MQKLGLNANLTEENDMKTRKNETVPLRPRIFLQEASIVAGRWKKKGRLSLRRKFHFSILQ